MKAIDINCDMGESYGDKVVGNDLEIMPYISSVNIACGFHGGDPLTIRTTIRNALNNQLTIGAHPSFNDREGFGRRNMDVSTEDLFAILEYQISALKGITESLGGKLNHVKPHGALYNMMATSVEYSSVLVEVIQSIDSKLKVFGLPNSTMQKVIEGSGIDFIKEAFSDRAYNSDGSLVSRKIEGSVFNDANQIAMRVSNMAQKGTIKTIENDEIAIDFETVCIHGDTPNAVEIAKAIHQQLINDGFQIGLNG